LASSRSAISAPAELAKDSASAHNAPFTRSAGNLLLLITYPLHLVIGARVGALFFSRRRPRLLLCRREGLRRLGCFLLSLNFDLESFTVFPVYHSFQGVRVSTEAAICHLFGRKHLHVDIDLIGLRLHMAGLCDF